MGVARVTYNNMVDDKNYDIAPKRASERKMKERKMFLLW